MPFSWAGFYGGVNVGYAWGDPQLTSTAASTIAGPAVVPGAGAVLASAAAAPSTGTTHSAAGGFQVGYNLQRGWWVYGIETDLSVTRLQAVNPGITTFAHFFGGINTASLQSTVIPTASIDWFGTLRGRLGYAWNRILIYGTGGLAYGSTRLTDGAVFNGSSGNGGTLTTFNGTGAPPANAIIRAGWAAGGGVDYAYTNNIILSVSYLHVDLGSASVVSGFARTNTGAATVVTGTTTSSTSFAFDEVRVAASWKL